MSPDGPPAPPLAASGPAAARPPAAPPPAGGHRVSVLLIDDQPIIGEAVRRMLAPHADIDFRFCADPARALERVREVETTVILSDLVMPEVDGLTLVRRFRADEATRRIPLIVLSTKEDAATKAEAFALGANDYLVKLPDPVELVARIRHHSEGYISRLERDEAYAALAASQRALQQELEQAARYVRSLLPAPVADGGRLRVDWRFVPSASLGGDAFGYHWLDDDHFALYVLDVSGHGVGSALLGVSVLNTLRSRTLPAVDFRDPGGVATALNEAFRSEQQDGKYFTLWYGVYRASARTLRYAGAGHPPALLLARERPGAAPLVLPSAGPMPGVLAGRAYVARECAVPPGSRLLAFTDGLYEVREADGRVRTFTDFLGALGAAATLPSVEGLMHEARGRLGAGQDFEDDVSVVQVDFP